MNKFITTKHIGTNLASDLLVSTHNYEVRITCHPDQLLTPENARFLADTLYDAINEIEDEKAI